MRPMLLRSLVLFALTSVFFVPIAGAAQPDAQILVACPKPYSGTIAVIESYGGTVRYQYKNIDAIAVTIPQDRVGFIQALPEVGAVVKDRLFTLPQDPPLSKAGYGEVRNSFDLDANDIVGEAVKFTDVAPDGYFPADVLLSGAVDYWNTSGNLGQGVIVGIMDSGVAPVNALAGRVLGGITFLGAYPPIDDGLGPNDPANGAHGTWVASTVGANVVFGFSAASTLVQSLNTHLPNCVFPDFFGAGIDGVPMVGQAPLAEFYSLKVFNNIGQTANSVLLAAFDTAIDLKESGTVDLGVINGSFGGGTLFAAGDPFFAAMIQEVTDAGIVMVMSAGNNGPAGASGGDPGVARNSICVGSTSYPPYEKVLRDLQYGLGVGSLYRANDVHQTTLSSARGPTSDGRMDPDLVAPGFAIFAQGANGGLSIVSGTSFSSPQVAGAAALLLGANPGSTPDQIRAALLNGADPDVLGDNSKPVDQGFGFLNVPGAAAALLNGAPNPSDKPIAFKSVRQNISRAAGVDIIKDEVFQGSTGTLVPGQRTEFFIEVQENTSRILINISNVTPELPPAGQNQFFGDDLVVAIHSAKTHLPDYREFEFLPAPGGGFVLEGSDLDVGVARLTILGDWTNAGSISADVQIVNERSGAEQGMHEMGTLAEDDYDIYKVLVPAGAATLDLKLLWDKSWGAYPTNDMDMLVYDPFFNLIVVDNDDDGDPDGISLDSPERLHLDNPTPGVYTVIIDAFTVWNVGKGKGRSESYIDPSTLDSPDQKREENYDFYAKGGGIAQTSEGIETVVSAGDKLEFHLGQNSPNPFVSTSAIRYSLAREADVSVKIFNARGQVVRTLVNGTQGPGSHVVSWDGNDDAGRKLSSGIYLYQMRSGEYLETRKMIKID